MPNINIVLICENQKFVLIEECPPEPHATASRSVREKYDSWQLANNKARCYMLACMNDVLMTKHENMETAYEIWQMDVKTAFLNGHLDESIYIV